MKKVKIISITLATTSLLAVGATVCASIALNKKDKDLNKLSLFSRNEDVQNYFKEKNSSNEISVNNEVGTDQFWLIHTNNQIN